MADIELGIIGGSGLYEIDGLSEIEEVRVDTPFGKPSDTLKVGVLHGRHVAFLPRHGRGHVLTPSEVPYRANIYALKALGAKYVLSVSACGSLREDFAPGHVVIPDQLFDFTKGRKSSFFGDGVVAHLSAAHPFSPEFSKVVGQSVRANGGNVHQGGAFITVEGPRFSTLAESNLYRQWGMSIIGMTTSPEAFLAAEAQMAYAVMAHVTDYDVWHESEEPVTVEAVVRVLRQNTDLVRQSISHLVANMDDWATDMVAHHALKDALITDSAHMPADILDNLKPLIGDYLP